MHLHPHKSDLRWSIFRLLSLSLFQIIRFSKSKYPEKDHDAKILEIAFCANEVMRTMLGQHYVRPLAIGWVLNGDLLGVQIVISTQVPLL